MQHSAFGMQQVQPAADADHRKLECACQTLTALLGLCYHAWPNLEAAQWTHTRGAGEALTAAHVTSRKAQHAEVLVMFEILCTWRIRTTCSSWAQIINSAPLLQAS